MGQHQIGIVAQSGSHLIMSNHMIVCSSMVVIKSIETAGEIKNSWMRVLVFQLAAGGGVSK